MVACFMAGRRSPAGCVHGECNFQISHRGAACRESPLPAAPHFPDRPCKNINKCVFTKSSRDGGGPPAAPRRVMRLNLKQFFNVTADPVAPVHSRRASNVGCDCKLIAVQTVAMLGPCRMDLVAQRRSFQSHRLSLSYAAVANGWPGSLAP